MLVRHGGPDPQPGGGGPVPAVQRVLGVDLGLQLRQRFGDRHRLAAGARSEQDQAGRSRVQVAPGRRRGLGLGLQATRQLTRHTVDQRAQAIEGARLRVGAQEDLLARVPGAVQGSGEFNGVIDEQGPARARRGGEGGLPGIDAAQELGAVDGLPVTPADRARGLRTVSSHRGKRQRLGQRRATQALQGAHVRAQDGRALEG